jgi:hypothetical protein
MQMDLEDLTGEDFTLLLQRLLQESEYELVVLNMPARPSFLRAVYGCCNHMYSLQREGALYERAQARLLEDLRLESDGEELSNLQVVPMPSISGGFSMDASMYEELLFGEMAAFIRGILNSECNSKYKNLEETAMKREVGDAGIRGGNQKAGAGADGRDQGFVR